jgi:group I intron endonuclease
LEQHGYIYCIRNKLNGKVYIGLTSKTIEERYKTHLKHARAKVNRRLPDAINKYGEDNFEIFELEKVLLSEIEEKEIFYIKKYRSIEKEFGYNMTLGGEKCDKMSEWSEEDKQILYASQLQHREEAMVIKYGVKSWMHSKEGKEHRIKFGKKFKGLSYIEKYGEERAIILKKEMSEHHKASGHHPPPNYWGNPGYRHTEETKQGLKAYRTGKTYEEILGEEKGKALRLRRISMGKLVYKEKAKEYLMELILVFEQIRDNHLAILKNIDFLNLSRNFFRTWGFKKIGIDNYQLLRVYLSNTTSEEWYKIWEDYIREIIYYYEKQ